MRAAEHRHRRRHSTSSLDSRRATYPGDRSALDVTAWVSYVSNRDQIHQYNSQVEAERQARKSAEAARKEVPAAEGSKKEEAKLRKKTKAAAQSSVSIALALALALAAATAQVIPSETSWPLTSKAGRLQVVRQKARLHQT